MNWADPAALRSLSASIQWTVIGFALIAVGLQTAKHFVDLREKRISSALAAKKDQANEDEKRELREKLDASERRIRTLNVELSIDLQAKWKADRNPVGQSTMWMGSKAITATLQLHDGKSVQVDFGPANRIGYTRVDSATVRLSYHAEVLAGSEAFSLFPEQIRGIEKIEFTLPGVNAPSLDDTVVTIARLNAEFIANGRVRFSGTDEPRMSVDFKGADSGTPKLTLAGYIPIRHGG